MIDWRPIHRVILLKVTLCYGNHNKIWSDGLLSPKAVFKAVRNRYEFDYVDLQQIQIPDILLFYSLIESMGYSIPNLIISLC